MGRLVRNSEDKNLVSLQKRDTHPNSACSFLFYLFSFFGFTLFWLSSVLGWA